MEQQQKFLWGEKAWDAFARPCQQLREVMKQSGDKVYSTCKVQQLRV